MEERNVELGKDGESEQKRGEEKERKKKKQHSKIKGWVLNY